MSGVAFLFAGNLSARVGMLADLAPSHPDLRGPFALASERAGRDLWTLAAEGPEEELRRDPEASLAVLAADVALHHLVNSLGIAPLAVAGYGPGYHAAVVAAGVVSLDTALDVAAEEQRVGREMLGDREFGLLHLEGLPAAQIEDLLGDLLRQEVISLAAEDGPEDCTLAGDVDSLRQAAARLEAHGARTELLPHSLPRHTAAMLGVPPRLGQTFAKLAVEDPRTPIYSHFDGSIVLRGWQAKELMIRQVIYPVRWSACVRGLARNGIDTFVEVGPGTRLSGLVRRIEPGATVYDTDGAASIERLTQGFSSWTF